MIGLRSPCFSRLPRLPRGTKGASRGHSLASFQSLPRSCANSQNHNPLLFSRFRTLLKIVFPTSLFKSVPCALFAQNTGVGGGVASVSLRVLCASALTSLPSFGIQFSIVRPLPAASVSPLLRLRLSTFDFQRSRGYSRWRAYNFHPLNLFRTLSRLPRLPRVSKGASRGRNRDSCISFLFVTSLLLYFITSLPGRTCATRHSPLISRCSTSGQACRRAKIPKLTAVELG